MVPLARVSVFPTVRDVAVTSTRAVSRKLCPLRPSALSGLPLGETISPNSANFRELASRISPDSTLGFPLADGLVDLSHQLAWHGVSASVEFIPSAAGAAAETLKATARSHDVNLLVMGGYGHSRTREIVFGGFTQSVLESAEMTVFLMQ